MFDFQQISRYRENNRLEAKLATGGLPRSIWETYSAFANTYGGVILLGVEELPDHTLRVQGLLEPRELVDEFTALLQNPRSPSGRGPVRFAPARPAGYGSTPPAAPGRAGAPRPAGREIPYRGPTGYRNRPPPMDRAWSSPVLPPSG